MVMTWLLCWSPKRNDVNDGEDDVLNDGEDDVVNDGEYYFL